ncbi:hypothetical protein BHE74_00033231, partial [Ensete ventricosum]
KRAALVPRTKGLTPEEKSNASRCHGVVVYLQGEAEEKPILALALPCLHPALLQLWLWFWAYTNPGVPCIVPRKKGKEKEREGEMATVAAGTTCPEPMSATSNGSWQGDNPLDSALPLAILQICLVIALTRFLAFVLRPLRQPRVVAEIIVCPRTNSLLLFLSCPFSFAAALSLRTLYDLETRPWYVCLVLPRPTSSAENLEAWRAHFIARAAWSRPRPPVAERQSTIATSS